MNLIKHTKIFVILLTFISCNNKGNDSFSSDSESQFESNVNEKVENSKFVYAVFTVEEPELIIKKEEYYSDDPYDLRLKYKDVYDVELNKVFYKSEIQEIYGYNEDIKYKILDDFQNEVNNQLILKKSVYSNNLWIKCKDDALRDLFKNYEFKIIDREVNSFDSYSEASKSKETF